MTRCMVRVMTKSNPGRPRETGVERDAQGRIVAPAVCPVCDGPFMQRRDGVPKTCSRHCARIKQHGRTDGHSGNWKGGRIVRKYDGYVYIQVKGHPNANKAGYVRENRYVMEQAIGRHLFRHEEVHHLNGDRGDNRIENLELWSTSQPSGQRVEDKVAWALEMLNLYGVDFVQPFKGAK